MEITRKFVETAKIIDPKTRAMLLTMNRKARRAFERQVQRDAATAEKKRRASPPKCEPAPPRPA